MIRCFYHKAETVNFYFSLTYPFQRHYGPGVDSASIRNYKQEYFLRGKTGRCVRADNLTTFMCRLSWNLGASISCNPQGLSRPVMGLLYLFKFIERKVKEAHLVTCLMKHCILAMYDWVELQLHVFLLSLLDIGACSVQPFGTRVLHLNFSTPCM
jgi:hypothetical protein